MNKLIYIPFYSMFYKMFELIPIKNEFLKLLQNKSKSVIHGLRPNFIKIGKKRFLHFYIFLLMKIYVFMLCKEFELIPIKFGFFMNF